MLTVFTVSSPLWAADGPWRGLPWHLIDYRHVLPDGQAFRSVAIEVEVVRPPQPGDHVYIAALWGTIGAQNFYVGLQTDLHDGRKRVNRGEGVIFSRWGNGESADARPPADGWVVVPNANTADEGAFVSVRRPMAWDRGRYLFQLQARPLVAPEVGMWVDLLVYDAVQGVWLDGGGLRFDVAGAPFRPRPVSFVEVYRLPPGGDQNDIVPVEILLRGPVLNGTLSALGGKPTVPPDVPPIARAEAANGGVRIVVEP